MVEASIGAEGASSNALAAESDDTRAKLFRAFSTPLRAGGFIEGRNSTPRGEHGQAPRLARAKTGLRNT
jgi:hypothetical protein